jgi:hypothetical protein
MNVVLVTIGYYSDNTSTMESEDRVLTSRLSDSGYKTNTKDKEKRSDKQLTDIIS